jgi:hypothetical protein
MPRIDEGAAYARNLSQRVKSYVDIMLAPFLRSRVQIYVARIVRVDRRRGHVVVRIQGVEYKSLLGSNNAPNLTRYRYARVLYDSRTHIMYYDDVVASAYVTVGS